MTRAFLALGSNLGDRAAELRRAVASTPDLVAQSAVYETDPVGGPENQGPYLNMVLQLQTDRDPHQLLALCGQLETAAQRRREIHWGPRTLDVDVLWMDGVTLDEPDLQIPHPRLWERPFVLAPLAELAPDLVAPGWESRFAHLGLERLGRLAKIG
ncbi:MAG TPA: 2-amino-4-hydroxy-6-hydroxymethyldihydropteridine diphosphokinase [Candidatus Limnocylindrales bacterium]